MICPEIIAGELYKKIYDYLILSLSFWDWDIGNNATVSGTWCDLTYFLMR